jgi:hypothetical protein
VVLGREALARWKEFTAPWEEDDRPPETPPPVLVVSRVVRDARTFPTLAEACEAAEAGRLTLIEVDDNGPLYCPPFSLKDRRLVVRAGKGYRPLLVCDPGPDSAGVDRSFLRLTGGALTLENLDVHLHWPTAPDGAALVRAVNADFRATGCTFTATGRFHNGLVLAGLLGDEMHHKARLTRCLVRSRELIALDLRCPSAEALVEGCLVVGGDQPLLQVAGRNSATTTVRVVRSTLVGRASGLRVQPFTRADDRPGLVWRAWDALVTRANPQTGGELLLLEGPGSADNVDWVSRNCCYAGWHALVAGKEPVGAADAEAWPGTHGKKERDRVLLDPWPAAEFPEPTDTARTAFTPAGTPAAADAESGAGLIGCDLAALPYPPDSWRDPTTDHAVVPTPEVTARNSAPDIPKAPASVFAGARVDVTKKDLGEYLRDVQKTQKLAPTVVLILTGGGKVKTTPVHVKNTNLVIYFEGPGPKGPDKSPLSLTPAGTSPTREDALIQVDGGDLEVEGGVFFYPGFKTAVVPPYLLKVTEGNLRLRHCLLEVPPGDHPDPFRGLVAFEGSAKADLEQARTCAFRDCILISPGVGVRALGPGVRLGLNDCLVVAGTALDLVPGQPVDDADVADFSLLAGQAVGSGAAPGLGPLLAVNHLQGVVGAEAAPAGGRLFRPNFSCVLEQSTVAARQGVVRVADLAGDGVPQPVVCSSRRCVYLNPFADARAGLVLSAGDALPRGLLLWQGEGDLYDKRLWFAAAPAEGPPPDKAQPSASWTRWWGNPGMKQALTDQPLKTTFDPEKPQYGPLGLPEGVKLKGTPPGVDINLLRYVPAP